MHRASQGAWVLGGGAVGTALRELMTLGLAPLGWAPAGVVAVNLLGAFAFGVLVAVLGTRQDLAAARTRLFFGTGVLGGFTTYSALAEIIAVPLRAGSGAEALLIGIGMLAGGTLVTFAGMLLGARGASPSREEAA